MCQPWRSTVCAVLCSMHRQTVGCAQGAALRTSRRASRGGQATPARSSVEGVGSGVGSAALVEGAAGDKTVPSTTHRCIVGFFRADAFGRSPPSFCGFPAACSGCGRQSAHRTQAERAGVRVQSRAASCSAAYLPSARPSGRGGGSPPRCTLASATRRAEGSASSRRRRCTCGSARAASSARTSDGPSESSAGSWACTCVRAERRAQWDDVASDGQRPQQLPACPTALMTTCAAALCELSSFPDCVAHSPIRAIPE